MTREEAIKWVKSIKEKYIHGGDEAFDDARRKALDMAIEALQDKPAKHGKWINKQKPNINYIPPYNCSECGGAGYGTDYCPTAERRWIKIEIYLIGGKHENNRSNKAVTLAD